MSDETTSVSEVPQPPAPPAPPEEIEETSQGASEDLEGVGEDQKTGDGSEDPTEASEGEENPTEPFVTNGPGGQTVTMPDGRVITTRSHPYPVSNSELEKFELTHHGDQLRYPYVPGDPEYSPYSDPAVPNSHLAQRVESEIAGFGERVKQDSEAAISPMWNALKGVEQGEINAAIETGVSSGNVEL